VKGAGIGVNDYSGRCPIRKPNIFAGDGDSKKKKKKKNLVQVFVWLKSRCPHIGLAGPATGTSAACLTEVLKALGTEVVFADDLRAAGLFQGPCRYLVRMPWLLKRTGRVVALGTGCWSTRSRASALAPARFSPGRQRRLPRWARVCITILPLLGPGQCGGRLPSNAGRPVIQRFLFSVQVGPARCRSVWAASFCGSTWQ